MREKNFLSIVVFLLIICGIILGGNYLIKEGTTKEEEVETIKKDKSKDYIYFTNEATISISQEITYKDININIDSVDATKLEETLNNNMSAIRNSYTMLSDINIDKSTILYELSDDDIYQADFIKYNILESKNYLTIIVSSGNINVTNEDNYSSTDVYTISKINGKVLSNEDILTLSGVSTDTLNEKLKDYDGIITSYTLYFDKYQKVYANVVVESEDLTYNDSIKIN